MAATGTTSKRSDPRFWYLWSATTVSGLGDGVRFAAFALFAAVLTRDPLLVALVTVAGQLPWLLAGPFTGVVVDRFDRVRTLWLCELGRTALMGAFTLVTVLGGVGIAVLAGTAFLLSCIDTLADNLSQAITPSVAGSRSLDSANSLLFGGQMVTTEFIGTPIAAFLFAWAAALPFAVDTATFLLSALLIAALGRRLPPVPRPPRTARRPVLADTAGALRWLLRHPLLRSLCLLMGVLNFAIVGVLGIAVLYALEVLHVSPAMYGLLMALIAVGGLLGFAVTPALSARIGARRTLLLAFALCPGPLLVAALTSAAWVAAPALLLVGAAASLGGVVSTTLRLRVIPAETYGRVNAAYRLFVNGLAPLGAFAGGLAAQQFTLRAPFFVAAAATAALVVFGPRLLRGLRE
ncbi:MFS transporter [Amycolatopsis sp. DG1A-15b]|uniref:MFS transporter n=1 Tax=Amycolatopsis sp. DG1A-15b TaxID=3052846 RepID=UPI00255C0559|nr:MFS transporter [Amycolatopsis sp. DG1A-15b]WIX93021.1 MFS transporter [Amycolatopsis sp. DG1A-15b]